MSKIGYTLEDNYNQFSYSYRYLDAMASLIHIQTDVDAVVEHDNKIYVSYNSTVKKLEYNHQGKKYSLSAEKYKNFMLDLLQNLEQYPKDYLLGIYLSFNVDFLSLVKKSKNHVDDNCVELIKNFLSEHDNFYFVNREESIPKIVDCYKSILEYLSIFDDKHLSTFIRPIQDSYKLYEYLTDSDRNKDITDLVILENVNSSHADSNIANYFTDGQYLDKNYIGVSKLCCGYCHKYLEDKHYQHRGTHGVCDDKWSIPWNKVNEKSPIENNFKNSVEPIEEFNQLNPPQQHKRLSFDKNLELQKIDNENTLCNIKANSGLIKGYIFYEGKTVPCKYKYIDHDYEEVQIGGEEGKILSYYTSGYWGLD